MAVTFDARSEGERATEDTSLTIAHTVAVQSDRVLYVACISGSGLVDVSTVTATYNGTSMDVLFTDTTVGNRSVRVFRLVAPSTGTNNIVLSWSGSDYLRAVAASFYGVDQADPDDAQITIDGSGGGTSSTGDVTSAVGDMVMDLLAIPSGVTSLAAGAGQTEVNQITTDGIGAGYSGIGSSYEAGAATTTMSWSWSGFASYRGWAWNIRAATGGGGGGNGLAWIRA